LSSFPFAEVAQTAMSWISSYSQARTREAINAAQHITDDANTYSANLVNRTNADSANQMRGANNTLAAAQAVFGNVQRSIGNQNKLNAYGKQLDSNSQNLARIQDAMTNGSLEDGLRAAEQLGALHAQAAANGVGGASAAMLHNTLAMSAARQRTAKEAKNEYQTYDMLQQRMGLVGNMVRSMDQGQTFAPIDYTINVPQLVQSPIRMADFAPSAASQAFMSTMSNSMGSIMDVIGRSTSGGAASSNTLNMNDGWNNFSTKNFSSTPGLGSGTYNLGGESNGFFSTTESFRSGGSFKLL